MEQNFKFTWKHKLLRSEMCFCAFVSLWVLRCLPQAWKDTTQRNAKRGHTMTHILSSSQPGAGCTQILCQHLVMKPVTERFAGPNITETWHDFLPNHEFILIWTRQANFIQYRWVAVAAAQVLAVKWQTLEIVFVWQAWSHQHEVMGAERSTLKRKHKKWSRWTGRKCFHLCNATTGTQTLQRHRGRDRSLHTQS